ncbi:uncharacterized protein MONBRDRAFT_28912 [Monosiga brevicollis MX1]|uniref:Altronate hydrolase n=1 Tax=Monosiga brevicollis TaxID=81824 RepID=A9V9F3_MONBE|nr:uncharacterized protein MONBRDRAFT_28912 [Monosiga brevicollis MX1]EDQ85851.1 predicted protein [Monosiga brevicollis MX1]|eukprot:XP_001749330.1 hypothetical protein [Monosiga brevicollis MX1]
MARRHLDIGYDAAPEPVLQDNGILPSSALKGSLVRPDNAALALDFIAKGTQITSWGLPFGIALMDLAPGSYLCNLKSLATFADRHSKLNLPSEPTFRNAPFTRHTVAQQNFSPAPPTKRDESAAATPAPLTTFMGFPRGGNRGAGTRNYVVILGISSRAAGFARALERQFTHTLEQARTLQGQATCDGVVAVAHTEGGLDAKLTTDNENNVEKVLRVLAGFAVHPNVGAVLFLDHGDEVVTTRHVLEYIRAHDYPLDDVPYRALSLKNQTMKEAMHQATELVEELYLQAQQHQRVAVGVEHLCFAQQCGGSDAFSGISANPLAGWMARELVAQGGSAVLAETDELIGAESYVLQRVRDYDTADHFLQLVDRYYRYTNRRGHSPEGNPSGGNLYRGLYNITLKSAGAAMKKLPDVRLDHVLEYGQRLQPEGHGYAFMDSPGNDLESIAGQVAAGCNMIVFTTGNGSVTNFPFVPTIKVLTTTKRYQLLSDDMDVNAGRFLDGEVSLSQLGREAYQLFVRAASGTPTKGELAGHHQVQIWRNWGHLDGDEADREGVKMDPNADVQQESAEEQVTSSGEGSSHPDAARQGKWLEIRTLTTRRKMQLLQGKPLIPDIQSRKALKSLCSALSALELIPAKIADKIARQLNDRKAAQNAPIFAGLSRFVALPHTEGCGHSSGDHESLVMRTLSSYAAHPMAGAVVMLEHGCEKTHNGRFQQLLSEDPSVSLDRCAFASIQLDGGLNKVTSRVEQLLEQLELSSTSVPVRQPAAVSHIRIGILATTPLPTSVQAALGLVVAAVTLEGGTVVLAGSHVVRGHVLQHVFSNGDDAQNATLGYGQMVMERGLHIMSASTIHPVELATGLGATGVDVMLAIVKPHQPLPPHPLIPIIQAAVPGCEASTDIDLQLDETMPTSDDAALEHVWAQQLLARVTATLTRTCVPPLFGTDLTDFQLSRAAMAVSM